MQAYSDFLTKMHRSRGQPSAAIFWTKGRISRLEGGLLLGLYVLYLVDNVLPRTAMASWADEFRLVMLCAVIPIVMIVIFTQAVFYWRDNQNSPTT